MNACYVKPIVGSVLLLSRRDGNNALFSIECSDETALFDPLDKGWIDNPIRIGLLRLRVLSRHNIQGALDDFH